MTEIMHSSVLEACSFTRRENLLGISFSLGENCLLDVWHTDESMDEWLVVLGKIAWGLNDLIR